MEVTFQFRLVQTSSWALLEGTGRQALNLSKLAWKPIVLIRAQLVHCPSTSNSDIGLFLADFHPRSRISGQNMILQTLLRWPLMTGTSKDHSSRRLL